VPPKPQGSHVAQQVLTLGVERLAHCQHGGPYVGQGQLEAALEVIGRLPPPAPSSSRVEGPESGVLPGGRSRSAASASYSLGGDSSGTTRRDHRKAGAD
jgi:hypothetical protein